MDYDPLYSSGSLCLLMDFWCFQIVIYCETFFDSVYFLVYVFLFLCLFVGGSEQSEKPKHKVEQWILFILRV